MNALFTSLYLDEDVDVLVASLLRARGFGVTSTVEAGNLGKTDEEQLAFATTSGRAMVTHNRADFERLAAEWFTAGRSHRGLVIAVRRPAHDIVRRLLVILNDLAADEMNGQVRYI